MGVLAGKVAVVTGAGRGIGRAIALALAEEGARVVVNDLGGSGRGDGASQEPAAQVVAEIKAKGGMAAPNYDTVTTMQGGENIIKTAVDNFGRIDILVNNAGILRDRMIFNMTEEEWDAVIAVHLKGHFTCTKFASILMRQQRWGRILCLTSRSGIIGNAGQANYCAAKAGIWGFVNGVARDLGRYGITCNCIAPVAATRLMLSPEVLAALQIRKGKGIQSGVSAGQAELPDPEYVAPLAVYLAREEAANINGQCFHVSGGLIQRYDPLTPVRQIYKDIDKLGKWTQEELEKVAPRSLLEGMVNPAPAPAPA